MFSADGNNIKSLTVASVRETSEIAHETFGLEKANFNGFGVFYAQFLDSTFPKIHESINKSSNILSDISDKLNKTQKQMNKIAIKRLREQKLQNQNPQTMEQK